MSLPVTIASWAKNSRETLKVQLTVYSGRELVDIRNWWTDKAGELQPGKGGITIGVRHLPQLAAAVIAAEAEARRLHLLDDGKADEVAK